MPESEIRLKLSTAVAVLSVFVVLFASLAGFALSLQGQVSQITGELDQISVNVHRLIGFHLEQYRELRGAK